MISLGIDIGTTTLRATMLKVSMSPLGERGYEPLSRSLCVFTPFLGSDRLDAESILKIIDEWMTTEKLPEPEIGTVLFTGEAQRAGNCPQIGAALLDRWPGLLCAQLDPHLESLVAAHGAGARKLSGDRPGRVVIHVDIGGGTSNYAWIENGEILDTACLDVGGRKWIIDPPTGRVIRRTKMGGFHTAERLDESSAGVLAKRLATAIVDFISGNESQVPADWIVSHWKHGPRVASEGALLSLSGGVVDCWSHEGGIFAFGDIGPALARALRDVINAQGLEYCLSPHAGRATALGVSAFGFQVSGNSIHGNFEPLRNIPLWGIEDFTRAIQVPERIAIDLTTGARTLREIEPLAKEWASLIRHKSFAGEPLLIFVMEPNIAKTFGYLLQKQLPAGAPRIWTIDGIDGGLVPTGPARTLDIGRATAEGRLPIVVKALRVF